MSEFLQRLKERKLVQWAIAYVAADPVWDPIRNDPRFKTLLAKYVVSEKSAAR